MSSLSDKAAALRKEAEQKRATWTPTAEGWPLAVYQWWCRRTGHAPERENFCHYWRVVLIWALLRWVKEAVTHVAAQRWAKVVLGVVVTAAVTYYCWRIGRLSGLVTTVLYLYFLFGIVLGVGKYLHEQEKKTDLRPKSRVEHVLWLPMQLGYRLARWAKSDSATRLRRRIDDLLWQLRCGFVDYVAPFLLILLGMGGVGLYAILIFLMWEWSRWFAVVLALGSVTAVLCMVFGSVVRDGLRVGMDFLLAPLRRWQNAKREARTRVEEDRCREMAEPALRYLFEQLRPWEAGDEDRYVQWRTEYLLDLDASYFSFRYTAAHMYRLWTIGPDTQAARIPSHVRERIQAMLAEIFRPVEYVPTAYAMPPAVKAPFRAVWGFVKLLLQVFRVWKWKICPWVDTAVVKDQMN